MPWILASDWLTSHQFFFFQPLEEGFTQITEKLNKAQKLVWFNMRQEPVAYIQVCFDLTFHVQSSLNV